MTIIETPPGDTLEVIDERRKPHKWSDRSRRSVLVFATLFVITELVGAFVSVPAQAALDAFFAFAGINIAVFGFRTRRTTGLVMAALFVDRLIVLTVPASGIDITTRIGIVGGLTIAIAYIATWVLGVDITGGRSDEGFALRKPLISRSFTSALTILSGFPIGWLAYEFTKPHALVVQSGMGGTVGPWAIAIGAIVVGAFGEELLYRRLVAAMVQHTGQSQTPAISAVIYSAAFLGTHNVGMVLAMFGAGAFFAWSCERTGSIKPVFMAHAVASVLAFVVIPH